MKKVDVDPPVSELKPLNVKCSDTRCNEGFHYFTSDVKSKKGICKECEDHSIDFKRLHKRSIEDIQYTVKSLNKELLRHVCWSNRLENGVIEHAEERGLATLREKTEELLNEAIKNPSTAYWDNMKTKKSGNEIIHYAQHATATCCRKCLKHWHDIPADSILTTGQMEYFKSLIEYYLKKRVPGLKETGKK